MTRDLLRILALWRPRAAWLAFGAALSLAGLGAAVALTALAGATVAAAFAGGALAAPVALRGLGAGRVVLRYAERLATHAATFRALADTRVWFFRRLAASGAGGLGWRRAGDLLSRLVADIEALDGLYLRLLLPLAGAALLIPCVVALLAPTVLIAAIAIGALLSVAAFALPWAAYRTAAGAGGRLADAAGALRVAALDALTGIREIRAFAAEGRVLAGMQAREAALLAAQRDLADRTAAFGALAFLCGQAALAVALVAAAFNPALGALAAFLVVAAFEAVGGLPRAGAYAGHAAAAAHRVLDAADTPAPVAEPAQPAAPPTAARLSLRFDAVRFRWADDRPEVLSGLTIDIPPGARVAILGPSGAGKSTLAALALKAAEPSSGRVLLGGVDIASLPADAVRARVAWLSQATHLFADTIRANLLIAKPGATDAELWAALDAARIGDLARALPDRLDTWAGEGGARFSGGQGRRLALARALLSPAPVLILDEPCAGLDAETERAFLADLGAAAEGRTVVLIAHRLTGAERVDRIYRLSGGVAVAAAG